MDKKFVISGRERTADLKTVLFGDRGARIHREKDLAPVPPRIHPDCSRYSRLS